MEVCQESSRRLSIVNTPSFLSLPTLSKDVSNDVMLNMTRVTAHERKQKTCTELYFHRVLGKEKTEITPLQSRISGKRTAKVHKPASVSLVSRIILSDGLFASPIISTLS